LWQLLTTEPENTNDAEMQVKCEFGVKMHVYTAAFKTSRNQRSRTACITVASLRRVQSSFRATACVRPRSSRQCITVKQQKCDVYDDRRAYINSFVRGYAFAHGTVWMLAGWFT